MECRWAGRGGGRGRNVELSRGTQRGHHGECRTDGWHWPIRARFHSQTLGTANGSSAVGWAGPALQDRTPAPPPAARGSGASGPRRGVQVGIEAALGPGKQKTNFGK